MPGRGAVLTLASTDCTDLGPGRYNDQILFVIASGQTATITMSSTAFDPFLRLRYATVFATDDNGGGGTSARIVYTNTGPDNNFLIDATSVGAHDQSLAYLLGHRAAGRSAAPLRVRPRGRCPRADGRP